MADNGNNDSNNVNHAGAGAAQQAPPELMSSFFPSPPSTYIHYTLQNLVLAKKLTSHESFTFHSENEGEGSSGDDWKEQQGRILKELNVDEKIRQGVRDIDLRWLVKPPAIELIEEDGHWIAFGQAWPINEALPTLEEMGVKQLFKQPETFEGKPEFSAYVVLHH